MAFSRRSVVIIIVAVLAVLAIGLGVMTLLGSGLARPVQGCTMIGCFETLAIEFEGFQPETYSVEVSSPSMETVRFECPTPGASNASGFTMCTPNGVNLSEVSPDDITVKVSWEGGSKTETFHVSYETYQPNGPQCEPTCRSGKVTMTLP